MVDKPPNLSRVQETLLYTLYDRALDYRSPAPILGDQWSDDVLRQLDSPSLSMRIKALDRYMPVLRAKRIDDWSREFLANHPDAVVVQLACGLDSRAFRIDPDQRITWFDVDYPAVIALRTRLYPARENYQTIASSVTDPAWLDTIPMGRPVLVIAEGLLMYLSESDVKDLLARLTNRFSEGEFIFDIMAAWLAKSTGIFGYKMWGLDDPQVIEGWQPRLELADDIPATADYARITALGFRYYTLLLNTIPAFRKQMRTLRYRLASQ